MILSTSSGGLRPSMEGEVMIAGMTGGGDDGREGMTDGEDGGSMTVDDDDDDRR